MQITFTAVPDGLDVPDWWTAWFPVRQREIRRRILTWLGRAGAPMALLQIQQRMDRYSTNEVAHALTTLRLSGAIVAEERETRVECLHGTRTDRTLFFGLAPSAEPLEAQR